MKKWRKSAALLMICIAFAIGLTSVKPVSVFAETTTVSEEDVKKARQSAISKIEEYAKVKQIDTQAEISAKINTIAKKYVAQIGSTKEIKDGLTDLEMIETCVADAKKKMDAVVSGTETEDASEGDDKDNTPIGPSSSSDFILVGGDWVVPTVSYGQSVNIVLPVVNMGTENLHDVLVTPVVGNTVAEWPFVLDVENYTQKIPDLPGKLNGQNDMDRRRELTWTLRARDDAMTGYYKLQFSVLYYVGAETESCTLTTYVRVNGAAGSGSIENEGSGSSTPRVIVTGFSTEPAKVYAGDTFKLTLHLQNTSKRTDVSNMLVNITAPSDGADADSSYAAFLPTSGSNTSYINKISKGSTMDLTVELTAKKDLSQKPYQIDVNMEFEDEDFASFTSNADVSIPIHQDARFELSTPEVLPDSIMVGSESNIMFSIYNTGRLTLYNAKIHFEGDCVTGGEAYLGKIEPSGTGNVDVMVAGAAATTDENSVLCVVTYEDENGTESRYEQPIKLIVTGGEMDSDMGDMENGFGDDYMMDDFQNIDYEEDVQKKPVSIIGVIVGIIAALVVIAVVIFLVKRAKRKKEEKEMSTLLSDLEGEGGSDEIS